MAHRSPQVCCREWPQGGSPGNVEKVRGAGKAQRGRGRCWGSALQHVLWGRGGRWMTGTCEHVGDMGTWRHAGRWQLELEVGGCHGPAGCVLSPRHCGVVPLPGAVGDSVTAIPWRPKGHKQGAGSISQGLALLRQCHSATTTRGGARALAQVFTPGYFSLHEEGLAVLAGGFLPAVLKTAIGLSRISNPRPSPQLSFWGLPQKLGAQKETSLPPKPGFSPHPICWRSITVLTQRIPSRGAEPMSPSPGHPPVAQPPRGPDHARPFWVEKGPQPHSHTPRPHLTSAQ